MTVDVEISTFWDDSPELWDTVTLAGRALPGIARVTATHGRKLDVKSPAGANGATITDKGYEPAKIEITLKLWTREQFDQWATIAPTLTYRREPPRPASVGEKEAYNRNTDAQQRVAERLAAVATAGSERSTEQELAAKRALISAEEQRRNTPRRARSLIRHDFEIGHPALDQLQVHRVYIEEVSTVNPSGSGIYEVKIKAIESKPPQQTRSVQANARTSGSYVDGTAVSFDAQAPSTSGGAAP